jgi:hypothetical protein
MASQERPNFLEAANLCFDILHDFVSVHGPQCRRSARAGRLAKVTVPRHYGQGIGGPAPDGECTIKKWLPKNLLLASTGRRRCTSFAPASNSSQSK